MKIIMKIILLMFFSLNVFAQGGYFGFGFGDYGEKDENNIWTGTNTFNGAVTFSETVILSGSIAGDFVVDSPTFFVDSGNNKVGIGTITPDATLNVFGTLHIVGTTSNPSYPTAGAGFEVIYDTDAIAGGVNGGSGATIFQSFDRGAGQWRDVWFRGNVIQFDVNVKKIFRLDPTGIAIGESVPNETTPVFDIRGDADSDVDDVTDVFSFSLTPNSDPTLATWDFISTQSAGYNFDKSINYGIESQADDDYEISIPAITALSVGLTVTFIATTANTDGATLEITEMGDIDALVIAEAASIATALATGEILAGQVVTAVFDGTNWQVTSRLANDRN